MMVIQSMKNSEKEKAIISYLQWNLKKEAVDLPCISSHDVQDDFRNKIWKIYVQTQLSDEDTEIVKILVPLTDNPNAQNDFGETPIFWSAINGNIEMIKILLPWTNNPNAVNNMGQTPIYTATCHGHAEIVKILARQS